MSDPVKNLEIEDVLSSIRRLLSDGEEQAAAPRVSNSPRDPVMPARVSSRRHGASPLMLTPALRVGSDGPDAASEEDEAADVAAPQQADPKVASDAAEDDFAATLSSLGFTEFNQSQTAPRVLKPSELTEPEPEQEMATDPAPASEPEMRSRLEATIAELEAAITHKREDWEPDGSEEAPVMDWAAARADDTPFLSRRSASRLRSLPEAQPAAEQEDHEAPFAEVSESAPQPQDHTSDYRVADLYEDSADSEEAGDERVAKAWDESARLSDFADEAAPREQASGASELDEAVLRAIIAEVVREELQGPLGERLTRNVRKLVRREIHRALSNGSFD